MTQAVASRLLVCALLTVLTAAVYAPVRDHDFIGFDDRAFLVDNPSLEAGLSPEGVKWALTATRDGNWMPLTWLSFLADQQFFALAPGPVHLVNVALHILAACALFMALSRMTGRIWPSAFTALVFALHPLHVESVAWAIERKDVLSGFLFALCLWLYAGYTARPSGVRYAGVVLALAAGLLSKAMLVTLPFVLLLLDFWPLSRLDTRAERRRAVLEKLPLLLLAFAHSGVTWWTQASSGATSSFASLPIAERLANAAVSAVRYLGKALWPVDLAVFYPHPGADLSALSAIAAAACLLLVSGLAFAWRRRAPELLVGWLWYGGMLVPVIGVVQVGDQAMADRYTYLPLIGASLAVAFAVDRAARPHRAAQAGAVIAALIATAAMSVATSRQLAHWHDGLSLFQHAVAVTDDNPVALNGLGSELLERDRAADAIGPLERAVALRPDFVDAHVNLGAAYAENGRPEQAIAHLERGRENPRQLRQHFVYAGLGRARQLLGQPAAAAAHYQRAVSLAPGNAEYHMNLGSSLLAAQRADEARASLLRAEALGGDWPELHVALARVFERGGQSAQAIARYRRALSQRSDWVEPANNLAWLLATASEPEQRNPTEAVDWAERAAVATQHANPVVLDTLSVAYAAAGRTEDAQRTGSQAAALARAQGMDELAREIEARDPARARAEAPADANEIDTRPPNTP